MALVLPARPIVRDAFDRVLPNQNPCGTQTAVADSAPLEAFAKGFSTFGVIDASGCLRARISEEPPPLHFIQHRLDWRDYFDQAKTDAELGTQTVGIRKAYRSSVSRLVKIAVSTPLFSPARESGRPTFAGVLTGSLVVASTLVLPDELRALERDQVTVVLGPFQGDSPASRGSTESEYTYLSHPDLRRGAKVTLAPSIARDLAAVFPPSKATQLELPRGAALTRDGYEDPLRGGRWLAAFAPVGGTGYVVLVQTREEFVARQSLVLSQLAFVLAGTWVLLLGAWGGLQFWSREPKPNS